MTVDNLAIETDAAALSIINKMLTCINCMSQDDARGAVYGQRRVNGILVQEEVLPEHWTVEELMCFDIVIFDGGNAHGDSWIHTFYPKQLKHFFVDEAPLATQSEADIEVSLDGGVTWAPANSGVRLVYRDILVPGEDAPGELHVNATHEGLILDVWVSREGEDHNIGTSSQMLDDVVAAMVEEN